MLKLAVAIPTLVGSVLSMFAAGFIFLCYLILPPQRHFRHTLILNLAAADFINATNNTVSGIYALIHKGIPPGFACSFNGWLGQLTVQGTDFSILFIAVATVITLKRWNYKPEIDRKSRMLLTAGIWVVPLLTSTTGLLINAYRPVSGNWCWLKPTPIYVRYALGHGWRLSIITITIFLYTYLFIYIHQHFASLRNITFLNEDSKSKPAEASARRPAKPFPMADPLNIFIHNDFQVYEEHTELPWKRESPVYEESYFNFPSKQLEKLADDEPIARPMSPFKMINQAIFPNSSHFSTSSTPAPGPAPRRSSQVSLLSRDPLALIRRRPPPSPLTTTISPAYPPPTDLTKREKRIQKLLLLNAYPIGYILLWLPGIMNRFVELSGHTSKTLQIAQASTQFVGLANALVYGYNEHIWSLAGLWWESRKNGARNSKNTYDNRRNQSIHQDKRTSISWPLERGTPS